MVSLRRRKLLGLRSASSSDDVCESPEVDCVLPVSSDYLNRTESTIVDAGTRSSTPSGLSFPREEQHDSLVPVLRDSTIKRRKTRRKGYENEEVKEEGCPLSLRGVYLKNMKWQAAIKVDKKQVHLGTLASREEAAHLYDRAAFMCGRAPNSELSEEEKQHLSKFSWEEFLNMTRRANTLKKRYKNRLESDFEDRHGEVTTALSPPQEQL